jgi:cytochrome P450
MEVPVFDLYSSDIDADPFSPYAALREKHPCYWADANQVWILSRFEDVSNAAQDWKTFSSTSGNLIDELPGRTGATLGTTDPPRHDRLRALAAAAFARKNMAALSEPTKDLARSALVDAREKKIIDFIRDFSSKVTVGLLFQMMGLPVSDAAEIRRKVVLSISTDKALRGRNDEQVAAFRDLSQFISDEVAQRRATPRDDLITALATSEIDGDKLSDREVVLTSATFVMAGVESLSSFMSMLALNLNDHPDARRRIVNEWDLLPLAIEESLRFNTSAQRFKRVATRDVRLHGQTIKEGDRVALAYGSANRDERRFRNPDVYDIERRPQGHLGFGAGPHFCLGSNLGRLVAQVSMKVFLEAMPEYHLATERLDWTPSSNFRSPVALPFEAGRA